MKLQTAIILTAASGTVMTALILHYLFPQPVPPPNIGWPVELIPEPEASAYYDGRKLINDNQRNYIDALAEGAERK